MSLLITTDEEFPREMTPPVKPHATNPPAGFAVIVTVVPLRYEHPVGHGGSTVPPPAGFTFVVSTNVVGTKLAVSFTGPFTVKVRGFEALLTVPEKLLNW